MEEERMAVEGERYEVEFSGKKATFTEPAQIDLVFSMVLMIENLLKAWRQVAPPATAHHRARRPAPVPAA